MCHNVFAYCDNNPIVREDPSGKAWWIIEAPISQAEAIARVASNKSVMSANYTKAKQVAYIFPNPIQEINIGKYGTTDFYPHFHIRGSHGDPHIWFYPGNK